MATATLQQLMVINKGIFTKPILESFFFVDVVSIMFSVSAVLVILAYIWSILTVAKE